MLGLKCKCPLTPPAGSLGRSKLTYSVPARRYPHLVMPHCPASLVEGIATIPTPALLGVESKSFLPDANDNNVRNTKLA